MGFAVGRLEARVLLSRSHGRGHLRCVVIKPHVHVLVLALPVAATEKLLRRDGQVQLVYKHAISTIMPGAPIQLFEGGEDQPA